MTDFDDLTKSYERHRQNLIKTNDHNKAALFDALAAASITSVIVSFDGEGDSGQINHVGAFAGDQDIQLPQTSVTVQETQWGIAELSATEEPLPEAIERVCYNYLEQEYGGWENNDGAYGEFTLNVADRTIVLEFNARFTDYNTTTLTF